MGFIRGSPASWHEWPRTHLPMQVDVRDTASIRELGRSPGGVNGNPLQYPCLENPIDRGAWWGIVHGVTKSRTQLKRLSTQHARAS